MLAGEIRRALRSLYRNWSFTLAVLLSLSMGIGVSVTAFSITDALLFSTLPVPQPNTLVQVGPVSATGRPGPVYTLMLDDLARDPAVVGTCGFLTPLLTIQVQNNTEAVSGLALTGGCFGTLALRPALGRLLRPEDSTSDKVAVISYDEWTRRFARSRNVIGTSVWVDGSVYNIVGVVEQRFTGLMLGYPAKYMIPLAQIRKPVPDANGANYLCLAFIRRKDDISQKDFIDHIRTLWSTIARRDLPTSITGDERNQYLHSSLTVLSGGKWVDYTLQQKFSHPLYGLLAITTLLLAVACMNAATLVLARGISKQNELITRLALGASRGALILSLALESGVTALAAVLLGITLGQGGVRLISRYLESNSIGLRLNVVVSRNVIAFAVIATLVSLLITCLFPAVRLTTIRTTLATQTATVVVDRRRAFEQKLLMVGQVTFTVVLLCSAGVFLQHIWRLKSVDLGFDAHDTLGAQLLQLPVLRANLSSNALRDERRSIIEEIARYPGVGSACLSTISPLFSFPDDVIVRPVIGESESYKAASAYFTAECFDVLNIRILRGGVWPQVATGGRGVLISTSLATRLFPNRDPIGQMVDLKQQGRESSISISGIAEDARLFSPRGPVPFIVYADYWTLDQARQTPILLVRSLAPPVSLIAPIRHVIDTHGLEFADYIRTIDAQMELELSQDSLVSLLATSCACLTLLLAAIGMFASMSLYVMKRRPEIGLRMALGAERSGILLHILAMSLRMAAWGMAAGAVLSICVVAIVRHSLYSDARLTLSLCVAMVLLSSTVIFATFLPALRAAQLQPTEALRRE